MFSQRRGSGMCFCVCHKSAFCFGIRAEVWTAPVVLLFLGQSFGRRSLERLFLFKARWFAVLIFF